MKTYLYRCFDHQGQLLYAGITGDVERRTRDHAKDKFWWSDVARVTRVAFETRFEALWAEWAVISTCAPVYNRALSPPPVPAPAELVEPALDHPLTQPASPIPHAPTAELSTIEAQLEANELRKHPRDRMRELVHAAHQAGIGPGKIEKKLKAEGYPTRFQTIVGWLKLDAAAGLLIQPGGNKTPYYPGPRMGFPYPARRP